MQKERMSKENKDKPKQILVLYWLMLFSMDKEYILFCR